MDKMRSNQETLFALLVLSLFIVFFVGCEKEESDGLISGRCGLKGLRVECNHHADCWEKNWARSTCNIYGWCYHQGYYDGVCVQETGTPCDYPTGTVCNSRGYCVVPCETHEDCKNGRCSCDNYMEISFCKELRCTEDGTCIENTDPVAGTLICAPNDEFLEGECIAVSGVCRDGYEKVGERGCVKLEE